LVFGTASIAAAAVIDFDDITAGSIGQVPSDYEGFTWGSDFICDT
jgi:hypothetical protein